MARQAVVDIALRGISNAARLYNSKLKVSCIPEELFALAFSLLPFSGRVTASHVCHRWRSICLDTATLWANIDTADGPVAMTLELLERSQNALLRVVACDGKLQSSQESLVTALCRNMDRVVSLTIEQTPAVLSNLLRQPAVLLEQLRIRGMYYGWLRDGTFSEDRCWPALRRLSIQGIGLCEYVKDARACVALTASKVLGPAASSGKMSGASDPRVRPPGEYAYRAHQVNCLIRSAPPRSTLHRRLRQTAEGLALFAVRGRHHVLRSSSSSNVIDDEDMVLLSDLLVPGEPVLQLYLDPSRICARSRDDIRVLESEDYLDNEGEWFLVNRVSMSTLTMLVLNVDQLPTQSMAAAPALHTLVLLAVSRIMRGDYLTAWDCPALRTLSIGEVLSPDRAFRVAEQINREDLAKLLYRVFGFSELRRLPQLVVRNMTLVDAVDGSADIEGVVECMDIARDATWNPWPGPETGASVSDCLEFLHNLPCNAATQVLIPRHHRPLLL